MPRKVKTLYSKLSPLNSAKGFTLPELLLTTAIIGTLATGSVVSYGAVRSKARDTQRVVDTKQIEASLGLYLDLMNGYPGDGVPGPGGLYLGEDGNITLSEAGFGPTTKGEVFMLSIPKNPTPFGTHYVYRSLKADGTDCNTDLCEGYVLLFALEKPQDGLAAGLHAKTSNGSVVEPRGFLETDLQQINVSADADGLDRFDETLAQVGQTVVNTVNDPTVQKANERVVAPSVAAATAFNTIFASSQFGQYLLLFLTQPAALLGMRRRKKWGTVFNSVTRMPVDLAIVRLRDTRNGRVMKSTVTDADGRYSFLVPKGNYRIEVAKVGLVFPSVLAANQTEIGDYHDLYYGDTVAVDEDRGAVLTPNIPVDVTRADSADAAVIAADKKKRWHQSLALTSPVLGAIVFVMRPTVFVGLLFLAEVVLYQLFKRLANPPEPKNWGTVYDKQTRKPVPQVVVRIFSAKYNKLLETQVTDAHGRYHFRVMGDVFFMTATKNGYRKTETDPFDLRDAKQPVVVASDLPLASAKSLSDEARKPATVGGSSQHAQLIKPAPPQPLPTAQQRPYSGRAAGGNDMPKLPDSLQDKQ